MTRQPPTHAPTGRRDRGVRRDRGRPRRELAGDDDDEPAVRGAGGRGAAPDGARASEDEPSEERSEAEPSSRRRAETVEAETVSARRSRAGRGGGARGLRARVAKDKPDGEPVAAGVAGREPADAEEDAGEGGKPPRARPLWARFLAASLVIVISMAAATSISLLVYLTDIAKGLSDNDTLASLRDQLDRGRRRRAADDPDHRLRQAPRDEGRPGPLGHDDPAARRPRQGRDRAALDPARPEGQHPRGRASPSSTRPTRPAGPTRRSRWSSS